MSLILTSNLINKLYKQTKFISFNKREYADKNKSASFRNMKDHEMTLAEHELETC